MSSFLERGTRAPVHFVSLTRSGARINAVQTLRSTETVQPLNMGASLHISGSQPWKDSVTRASVDRLILRQTLFGIAYSNQRDGTATGYSYELDQPYEVTFVRRVLCSTVVRGRSYGVQAGGTVLLQSVNSQQIVSIDVVSFDSVMKVGLGCLLPCAVDSSMLSNGQD